MSGARVIQLGAPSSMPQPVSFEEAFGEFSNAQGKGRARRKARKLERIENRAEVKAARQGARQEKIAGRQQVRAGRTAGREELQMARKAKRLGKREMGLESRLARKEARTMGRMSRRDLRNPQQVPSTESAGYQGDGLGVATTTGMAPGTESNYAPGTTSGYAPTTSGSGYYAPSTTGSGYYDVPSQATTASQYFEPQTTSSGYAEDVYDQSLIDETATNAYDMGYQDAQEDAGLDVEITGDEDYGDFDGVMGAEDRYNELQDKNDMPVHPQVQQMADKCVWNQMLITKLKDDRKKAKGNPQEISKTILERQKRLKDLKDALDAYANDLTGYSNADSSPEMIAQRKRAVQMALNKARRKASGQSPISVTGVSRGLNPKFSKERIVVNSSETMSNFDETGVTAIDDINDFDAPATREFFIPADGGFAKGIDLGSIALGALLAFGFIYLNKQYKWIKM